MVTSALRNKNQSACPQADLADVSGDLSACKDVVRIEIQSLTTGRRLAPGLAPAYDDSTFRPGWRTDDGEIGGYTAELWSMSSHWLFTSSVLTLAVARVGGLRGYYYEVHQKMLFCCADHLCAWQETH